jgi:hypothetical protein
MSEKVIENHLEAEHGIVKFSGNVIVKGNVLGGSIQATQDITVEGTVIDGNIVSTGGSITIHQGIEGESSHVEAFSDIRSNYCHGGNVISNNGSIYFKTLVTNSKVSAKNLVHCDIGQGVIEKASVQAGIEIIANRVGNKKHSSTYVKLTNERQQEMFELMLVYEQRLKEKKKKLEKLYKVIKIVRLLGEKVVKLPAEKKQQLALKVKEYNKLKNEIVQTNQEKRKVIEKNKELKKYTRAIIVKGTVHPQVQVMIDKLKHNVIHTFEKVIFYKSGIIIMGDLDQFKLRQR